MIRRMESLRTSCVPKLCRRDRPRMIMGDPTLNIWRGQPAFGHALPSLTWNPGSGAADAILDHNVTRSSRSGPRTGTDPRRARKFRPNGGNVLAFSQTRVTMGA